MTQQQDDYLVDAILCHKKLAEQGEALALAHDTIRIALKTAGYENVDSMTQFERASALLNVAQELAALIDKRHATMNFETATNRKVKPTAWANGRGYNGGITA